VIGFFSAFLSSIPSPLRIVIINFDSPPLWRFPRFYPALKPPFDFSRPPFPLISFSKKRDLIRRFFFPSSASFLVGTCLDAPAAFCSIVRTSFSASVPFPFLSNPLLAVRCVPFLKLTFSWRFCSPLLSPLNAFPFHPAVPMRVREVCRSLIAILVALPLGFLFAPPMDLSGFLAALPILCSMLHPLIECSPLSLQKKILFFYFFELLVFVPISHFTFLVTRVSLARDPPA